MSIGNRIKELRERRGLTLEQVGAFVGVNKATVQRYEIDNIDIKRNVAIKLADCLGTTPAYIMGWTDDEGTSAGSAMDPQLAALAAAMDQLNEEGREKLLDYAADLVAGGRYIKNSQALMGQKQA